MTAAALKWEAAVDVNTKGAADRVASLQGRLGNKRNGKLRYSCSPSEVRVPVVGFCFALDLFIFTSLLKVLGGCIPGISGGPTQTPPPSIILRNGPFFIS